MQKEFDRLKGICKKSGIEQKTWSYRQHYLRYHVQKTSSILEQIGIAYDSTLTFAEIAGFRCGCCYEYPLYDLINRRRLKLREQPLLVMDRSLISPKYMNLNYDDAYDFITKCKQRCELFDGDFVILWHNNLVVEKVQKELYQSILSS